jgi:hypothetical protein
MGQVGFELQTHCTQAVNAGNLLTEPLKIEASFDQYISELRCSATYRSC